MSKSAKSKNATLKKVKKLERQGKYLKALRVCDEYLDNSTVDESLVLFKIDILVEYYNNDDFIGLINEYKIKLTHFLEDYQEMELLKIYNILDNYLELKTQNLASDGIVKSYLAGGLLVDNLETILVLNEMVKDNYESIKGDDEYIENKVPHELESFVENVLKTSYQYLELIIENPKEQISASKFDFEKIRSKIRQFLEPKKESDEGNKPNEEDIPQEEKIVDEELEEKTEFQEEEDEIIEELEEKSEVTLDDISKLEEKSEEDTLKAEDETRISSQYSVEDEINGLKDIISYLNDKNEFKKALIYQRRLVKLAREGNIKSKEDLDSKQRTLSEF